MRGLLSIVTAEDDAKGPPLWMIRHRNKEKGALLIMTAKYCDYTLRTNRPTGSARVPLPQYPRSYKAGQSDQT